jgi:hypothetical protein
VQRARQSATVETIEKNRLAIRDLYPSCVVAGWRHMRDDSGNEVAFSVAACRVLFQKLPDFLIDDIRAFADIPENFLDMPEPAIVDPQAVAGN